MEGILTFLRSFKILGFSIFDFAGSYLVVFLLLSITGIKHNIKYYQLVAPVSLVAHILSGTPTMLTKLVTNGELNIAKILLMINLISLIFF
jgi:hypothetical protein